MEKLETNIKTPKRNTGKDADIIEDLEIMAQSIQEEFNKKANSSITEELNKKLEDKVDKEKGKGLSTNDFTNILKEKLENLENYDDEEIRNLLNGSLKNVSYTANNGMMTFTKNDGSEIKVDLPLELLVKDGTYNESTNTIILILANNSEIKIPLSNLIKAFYGKEEIDTKLSERDNKITNLEKENKSQSEKIERLEKENEEQQKQIESLEADYNPNTLSGEIITITDGRPNSKISSIVNGNSYQETTEGYNLLQIDETNWELTDDGIKSLGKVGTSTGVSLSAVDINLKATVTYYLNFVLLSRPTNSVSFTTYTDNVKNDSISFTSLEKTANYTIGKVVTKTYTPTKDETLKVTMWGNSNSEIFEFQYWITTDSTKTTYEKYTNGVATPNTEYPQDIEVITECSLVQRGKNAFDKNKVLKFGNAYNENLDNEVIKIVNTAIVNYTWVQYLVLDISNYVGKRIYFTGKWKSSSSNKGRVLIAQSDINGTGLNSATQKFIDISGETKDFEVVENETYHYLKVVLYGNTDGTGFKEGDYIEYSDVIVSTEADLTYEPYHYEVHEINLNGNSLAKVGEIADLLKIGIDGSVSIEKKVGDIILNGTENWYYNGTTAGYRYYLQDDINLYALTETNEIPDLLSNMFKAITMNDTWNGVTGITSQYSSTLGYARLNLCYLSDETDTVEKWKSWLSTKLPKVLYPMLNPETINLPSIEPIELFKGTNIFELETNLGTTMSVTYKVSNKSRLEALENAILSLGGISNV